MQLIYHILQPILQQLDKTSKPKLNDWKHKYLKINIPFTKSSGVVEEDITS